MKLPHRMIERMLSAVLTICLLAAGPASQPVLDQTFASGMYHLASPPSPEWAVAQPDPASETILFLTANHEGKIQIALLPKDASVDPGIAGSVAGAVIKTLNQQFAVAHAVVLMAPKIERDKRFAIVIHEKFRVGDETCDQMHVYKTVGPRVMMLTVNSVGKDPDKAVAIHKAGEDALDSAKFDRKAFKKSK